jgi:DNA-directed RNA polymerase subunit RPC12/RpoP
VPTRKAWATLEPLLRRYPFYSGAADKQHSEVKLSEVSDVLTHHMMAASVTPFFELDPPAVVLTSGSLFGNLAVELAFVAMRVDGFYICSGCGTPYIPERKATTGTRRFCPRCRRNKVPQKLAQRDLRARRKEEHDA